MNEGINKKEEDVYGVAKKAFEDNSLENPFNKIKRIREKFASDLDKPVEFPEGTSALLCFSEDVIKSKKDGTSSTASYIKDFPEIISWNRYNILPNVQGKIDEFWKKLHAENGKSFKEMLDKTEELLLELKNECK